MLKNFEPLKKGFILFCLLGAAACFCWAGEQFDKKETAPEFAQKGKWEKAAGNGKRPLATQSASNPAEGIGEPNKYINLDEIRPGMEAYCLTCYEGTKIEKFALEVLSVVRNVMPGRDAILVQGTDERFIHSGPVAGCSGSPVYIDGRLAGALSFGVYFSKDPLYGVTPIGEMLEAGKGDFSTQSTGQTSGTEPGFAFDFSKPIDFAEIDEQIRTPRFSKQHSLTGITTLPCPLISSGLPAEVCEQLNAMVEPFGLMVVSGTAGGSGPKPSANTVGAEDVKLAPGACLTVPLVTGDVTIEIIGTVTDVVDNKVYGFGHSLLGYGPIDLPMGTGQVHTVVANVLRSFKFASALETVGALRTDKSAAVIGQIGAEARTIPLTIKVNRYNDLRKRVYNCRIANNRLLTPMVLGPAVAGAALMLGELPPDHAIKYQVVIGVEGFEPVTFENVSTNRGLEEMIKESIGPVALIMNNPYRQVNIKSVEFDIQQMNRSVVSHIWSVDLCDSKVKTGEQIEAGVVVESFLGGKKKYRCSLKIPAELAPGEYDLIVCGGYEYQEFLRRAVPYKFVPQNMGSLIEAINNVLAIKRDKLYCVLVLPPGGVTVEKAELPDLPATKALVLQDTKRTLRSQPYLHWLEDNLQTDTVIIDKKVMRITVEK